MITLNQILPAPVENRANQNMRDRRSINERADSTPDQPSSRIRKPTDRDDEDQSPVKRPTKKEQKSFDALLNGTPAAETTELHLADPTKNGDLSITASEKPIALQEIASLETTESSPLLTDIEILESQSDPNVAIENGLASLADKLKGVANNSQAKQSGSRNSKQVDSSEEESTQIELPQPNISQNGMQNLTANSPFFSNQSQPGVEIASLVNVTHSDQPELAKIELVSGDFGQPINASTGFVDVSGLSDATGLNDATVEKFSQHLIAIADRSVTQSVIQQVVDSVTIQTVTNRELNSRELTLQIHPAELGRLEIFIGSDENNLRAHIVASESVTSELLAREKAHLVNALREQGIDLSDVDISHRDPRDQDQQQFQSPHRGWQSRQQQGSPQTSKIIVPIHHSLQSGNRSAINIVA